MDLLSADATEVLLPYGALADELRAVLLDTRRGAATAPPRQAMPLAGGTLLVMPAADTSLAITKLVTVHLDNASRGLPTIQGEVVVLDARTGRRLVLLDGRAVTTRRTAALSLLAARTLAQHPQGPLLVVGAGAQGRAHLHAFVADGVGKVYVASRTRDHAEALAGEARTLGTEAAVLAGLQAIPDDVRLIVTATSSAVPVLPDAVHSETFIAAVGAFRPSMAELPASLVRRARLYVDTIDGAREEAGDLIQAGVDWQQVTALADAISSPRPSAGPVVFKSVGCALWDLAAARLAVQHS